MSLILRTVALMLLVGSHMLPAQPPAAEGELRECLVITPVGRGGRSAVHTDAIESQIVAGAWTAPKAGDEVRLPDGAVRKWEVLKAGNNGSFTHAAFRGGYAYCAVPSDEDRVMILEASAHGMVYVNGELRPGDPYGTGYVRLPVQLRRGTNDLLFNVGRGSFRAKLVKPKAEAFLDIGDATLPDLIVGQSVDTWGALIAVNATAQFMNGLEVDVSCNGAEPLTTTLPSIPPLSIRKFGFRLQAPAPNAPGQATVKLGLHRRGKEERKVLDIFAFDLVIKKPDQTHKRTFISKIDGSVQYFAIVPAKDLKPNEKPGLILTLHGAGVEGIGQAACYAPKPNTYVVAPTNRRPYGFDWEEWGRLDAMEVLELVEKELGTDPRKTYLTGHSMGGHGTWHIGVTFPDRFAAIGPSAGWISMGSYAGAGQPDTKDAVAELLQRAASPSDTLALKRNYAMQGVYVLHGERDDNVPVTQARIMRKNLGEFHPNFAYHEQPNAGHWWGNPCVDWPPMIEFFERKTIPERKDVRELDFTTANPGVSARCHWLRIEAQTKPLKMSKVRGEYDPEGRQFICLTENVARLSFDVSHMPPDKPVTINLDRQEITDIPWPKETGRVWLQYADDKWSLAKAPSSEMKGPHRNGPFKDAFRNRMIFVYGTQGTPEENAATYAKARYDAETFWYRGNGSVDLIPDTVFEPSADRDRNVILYGNADTNRAWDALLKESPVQFHRGGGRIGEKEMKADDLGCLFVRPRPGSNIAVVGVVTGTGAAGMRLLGRVPYFVSGVGIPDCVVFAPSMLISGNPGVRVAGYFGNDWDVATGEFAWRD